jgi:hypothetical protein
MLQVDIEQLAKVIRETREAALKNLQVSDPYRAGFLGASARITFEFSKSLPSDVAEQFRKTVGF